MLAVVVLGVGLVLVARSSREEKVAPFRSDHWHAAYEIYDCGSLAGALQTQLGPDGIHTHADGLIHIHPGNSSATGKEARLGVFMDATGLSVTTDGIDTSGSFDAGFTPVDNATGCDGTDSEIVVTRWNVDGADGLSLETTYRGDFADIGFLHEREAFTIAKVPVGEDAPAPSAAVLAQLDASTNSTNLVSETTTTTAAPDDSEDSTTTTSSTTTTTTTAPDEATDGGDEDDGSDAE